MQPPADPGTGAAPGSTGAEAGAGPPVPAGRDELGADELSFLICVEANRLEPQARLLCDSIRTFGGRHREAPIVAVSPRPELALGRRARARLERLGVRCVVEKLNETGSRYGTINRVVAAAWAEENLRRPYLVVLDTDTILVGEPRFPRADAGVRPVDVKGSASSGEGDPLDLYWRRICGFAGISPSHLPGLATTVDGVPIRACYNGGFAVVRRELGILARTREVFFAALAEGLRPQPGTALDILASTGHVGREVSEWWGASQAALSAAIWSRTADVRLYDERYNIPVHILAEPTRAWPVRPGFEPVLVHYHYLAEPPYQARLLDTLSRIGCRPPVREWVAERLHFFG